MKDYSKSKDVLDYMLSNENKMNDILSKRHDETMKELEEIDKSWCSLAKDTKPDMLDFLAVWDNLEGKELTNFKWNLDLVLNLFGNPFEGKERLMVQKIAEFMYKLGSNVTAAKLKEMQKKLEQENKLKERMCNSKEIMDRLEKFGDLQRNWRDKFDQVDEELNKARDFTRSTLELLKKEYGEEFLNDEK